jgi:hypothetical protein
MVLQITQLTDQQAAAVVLVVLVVLAQAQLLVEKVVTAVLELQLQFQVHQ